MYLPSYKVTESDSVVQVLNCPLEQIHIHDLSKYCPLCEDEWCCNGVRTGIEWMDTKTPIIDDRLYEVTL